MDQENNNKEEIDLSDSLRDDSGTGVKFQEYRAERYYPETPKIIQWAMKYSGGLIKNEKQANYVLIGFVAVAIIVFLTVVLGGGSSQPTQGPVPIDQFVP